MFKKILNKKYKSKEQTIEAMKSGSAEAFHLIYNEHSQKVYRFCLRMLGDPELAEDAFQDIFVKVYEKKALFEGNNFNAWLFTIARNTCLNVLRSKRQFDQFDEDFHGGKYEMSNDIGVKKFIEESIQKLPIALREALLLREYEDCTYKEIAGILDIDMSLAKVRVHRARLHLRKLLEPLAKELNES